MHNVHKNAIIPEPNFFAWLDFQMLCQKAESLKKEKGVNWMDAHTTCNYWKVRIIRNNT